jgi:Berberine and berberine like
LIKYINLIPGIRQYTIISHVGHGKLTRPNSSSCFATRQPHILFHINAIDEVEHMTGAKGWVEGLVSELKATGEVMKPVYVNFMGEDEQTDVAYGENWERLRKLKQRVDSTNFFQFAQPKIL